MFTRFSEEITRGFELGMSGDEFRTSMMIRREFDEFHWRIKGLPRGCRVLASCDLSLAQTAETLEVEHADSSSPESIFR